MLNVNKHRRFPRMALWRRVDRIMAELDEYRRYYFNLTRDADTPAVALRAAERAEQCDELWHELSGVRTSLGWMS